MSSEVVSASGDEINESKEPIESNHSDTIQNQTKNTDNSTHSNGLSKGDEIHDSSVSEQVNTEAGDNEENKLDSEDIDAEEHLGLLERTSIIDGKRERKKTKRLSEAYDDMFKQKSDEKNEKVDATLQGGKGTSLSDIPLIEASLRKVKPGDLKVLHLIVFGRLGAANEVRGNLLRFRGFGFSLDSKEYENKKMKMLSRPMSDIRDSLRILHMELSGSRDQIVDRLLEFLLKPSANKVKYKGKLIAQPVVPAKLRKSKAKSDKITPKVSKSRKQKRNTDSSDESSQEEDEDNADSGFMVSNSGDEKASASETSDVEEKSARKSTRDSANKRKTPVAQPKPLAKSKQNKKRVLTDSDSEENISFTDTKRAPKKSKRTIQNKDIDTDEDIPLKAFKRPSDEELKSQVLNLLKEVNLETTSLRVVRDMIFEKYPGFDLTDKKEFINAVVKQYLADS